MKRVSAKLFPKLLMVKQKETYLAVVRDLLHYANQDANLMKTLITSDESWVWGYDPETKAQSSQRMTLRPKKVHQVHSELEVMLTVFFDHKGIIHHEYTPDGRTVIKKY
jgi:hypothetical protein